MCRQLAAKLARKRPSPLQSGQVKSWAAGIVHTICQVNFAFDKTQTPHVEARALAEWFGVGKSTPANKASDIKKMLNIGLMEPEWTLPSRMDSNPMAWYISVNGFIVDARSMPREIQEAAFHKGLIPYIPADTPD